MLRSAMVAAAVLALTSAGAGAEEQDRAETVRPATGEDAPVFTRDRFVVSGDACGASRYRHLVGREFARVYDAALLPSDSLVQNRTIARTLEYTPHRLNVVVGSEGRIIAIGCF